jgi:hypothetical protein
MAHDGPTRKRRWTRAEIARGLRAVVQADGNTRRAADKLAQECHDFNPPRSTLRNWQRRYRDEYKVAQAEVAQAEQFPSHRFGYKYAREPGPTGHIRPQKRAGEDAAPGTVGRGKEATQGIGPAAGSHAKENPARQFETGKCPSVECPSTQIDADKRYVAPSSAATNGAPLSVAALNARGPRTHSHSAKRESDVLTRARGLIAQRLDDLEEERASIERELARITGNR